MAAMNCLWPWPGTMAGFWIIDWPSSPSIPSSDLFSTWLLSVLAGAKASALFLLSSLHFA
jgi:hypothetical protein